MKKSNKTDEFSFILKSSKHGVGVFALHDIEKGTFLKLFGFDDLNNVDNRSRKLETKSVPEELKVYCVFREGGIAMCPKDFSHMHIGWYLNHSSKPNAYHKDYNWYALKDINAGEEILIDYNSLEEPESSKEEYYYA